MMTTSFQRVWFALVVGVFAPLGLAAPPQYTITNLGVLPGYTISRAFGLNSNAEVVGTVSINSGSGRLFHWEQGVMTEMTGFGCFGAIFSAAAINDAGQAVGRKAICQGGDWHAFVWHQGTMVDLGTLGGPQSAAWDVNNAGQIVGSSQINTTSIHRHPVLWQNGQIIDLGTLGGVYGDARGINQRGDIVGTSCVKPNGNDAICHAFVHRDGVMLDLGALPGGTGSHSDAFDISDTGVIVGRSTVLISGSTPYHPIIWTNVGGSWVMNELPGVSGTQSGQALALNNQGDIVGTALGGAVLWRAGQMFALTNLLPPNSGWTLDSAEDISEAGHIVGTGRIGGATRAYLLTLQPGIPGDITGDGEVDVDDLLAVIIHWGPCPAPPAACSANIATGGASANRVDVDDLLMVITNWG